MVYGIASEVMALAYGGSKSVTPDIVTQALQQATSLINIFLNINEDLNPVPQIVNDVANHIAVEYLRKPRPTIGELCEDIEKLLGNVKDQLVDTEGSRWGNMRIVNPDSDTFW